MKTSMQSFLPWFVNFLAIKTNGWCQIFFWIYIYIWVVSVYFSWHFKFCINRNVPKILLLKICLDLKPIFFQMFRPATAKPTTQKPSEGNGQWTPDPNPGQWEWKPPTTNHHNHWNLLYRNQQCGWTTEWRLQSGL